MKLFVKHRGICIIGWLQHAAPRTRLRSKLEEAALVVAALVVAALVVAALVVAALLAERRKTVHAHWLIIRGHGR